MARDQLFERWTWQSPHMQLGRRDHRGGPRLAVEQSHLAEVVTRRQRPPGRLRSRPRVTTEDDVEVVGRGPCRNDRVARAELRELCLARDLPQVALADSFEQRQTRQDLCPVTVVRLVPVLLHQQRFQSRHSHYPLFGLYNEPAAPVIPESTAEVWL